MIENVNASRNSAASVEEIRKFIGVASLNIVAINPNNATLKKYGWHIQDGAEEPVYTFVQSKNGKSVRSCRLRFLCQIMDFDEKPIVALDFWCRESHSSNKDNTKFKIIDQFGRTAWATRDEIKDKKIPQYSTGQANISTHYTVCHEGEEELVAFLFKYLNITPFQVFDRRANAFVNTKNPGKLTIDNWAQLCLGNTSEIKGYVAMQPENRVKVILGIRTTEDNKTYQTFLNTSYFGNGNAPDNATGEYIGARKAIDRFLAGRTNVYVSFSALPVKEWVEKPTEVKDSMSIPSDMPNDLPEEFNDIPSSGVFEDGDPF